MGFKSFCENLFIVVWLCFKMVYRFFLEGEIEDFEKSALSEVLRKRDNYFYKNHEGWKELSFSIYDKTGNYFFKAGIFNELGKGGIVLQCYGDKKPQTEGYMAEFISWMEVRNAKDLKIYIE